MQKELLKDLGLQKERTAPLQPDAITTANAVQIGNLEAMAMDIGQMNWTDAVIACNALGEAGIFQPR